MIRSDSKYEGGTWDGETGFYKNIDNDKIRIFLPPPHSKFLFVPFYFIVPSRPTRTRQLVYCLESGRFWGRRYEILEYGDEFTDVTAFRGGKKGKFSRRVPTHLLAAASD